MNFTLILFQIPCMTEHGGFPGRESVVVLDNFSTHKNKDFINRVEAVNGVVCHLPPYSPDFNPVSIFF